MNKILGFTMLIIVFLAGCTTMPQEEKIIPENAKTAIFAGGCFWCMEAPFEAEPGVVDVVSGYTGGEEATAKYDLISTGRTKHREGVLVTYNPDMVSYERLVELYFWQINPTDSEGQFADKGYHYTTAIYYDGDEQKEIALQAIKDIDASEKFNLPVVTEVLAAQPFYLAESYHQDYYKKQETHYERYSLLSGRKGFIKKVWGGDE